MKQVLLDGGDGWLTFWSVLCLAQILATVTDAVLTPLNIISDDSLGKSHLQPKKSTRVIDYEIIIDFRVQLGPKKSIALVVKIIFIFIWTLCWEMQALRARLPDLNINEFNKIQSHYKI